MADEETLEASCALSREPITDMFRAAGVDSDVADSLYRTLESHFRQVGRSKKYRIGVGDSLPTDEVASEGFLRLIRANPSHWKNREHIFRTAALAME